MSWITRLRTKFWEIRNIGLRYKALRESKNKLEEYKSQYTLDEVSKRLGFQPSSLRKMESGGVDMNNQLFELLLKDLGVTQAEFDTGANQPMNPLASMGAPQPVVAKTTPTPAMPVIQQNQQVKRTRRTRAEMEALRAGVTNVQQDMNTIATATSRPSDALSVKLVTAINYTETNLAIKIVGDTMHIYEIFKEADRKKGSWVPPADVLSDGTSTPRISKL
jgi:transcriptional regulator with XRE-family HTH domain